MASFTDQIQQFNPYIQETPIQEMVQVGMAKQAQYNQGVQKIQSYIDRVAGLEIAKPQHKEYLQSLMGELGNRLKTVAAGDFSNQQLVNSVAGMTGQVAKDPIIQNAVSSTAGIKKGYADLEAAKKAGKSNKNNEDYYNNQVNSYMVDPDLKSPFNGKYTPYKDYTKKLITIADDLKKNPSGSSQDNPFEREFGTGKTIYYKPVKDAKGKVIGETKSTDPASGGMPRYDQNDMLRTKVKGVPAQQLYDTFNTTLDADDLEQMRIDSWANFRGADTKTFQGLIANTYQGKKEMLDQQIVDLAVALKNPKLTSAEVSDGKNMLAKLTKIKEDGVLDKEMNEQLTTFDRKIEEQGLDNYKFNIFKENKLTSLAKELSFKTFEEERLANPASQAIQKRREYELDKWKAQDASTRGYIGLRLEAARDAFTVKKWELENQPTSLVDVTEGTVGTDKTIPTIKTEREELTGLLTQRQELDSKWAKFLFPELKDPAQISSSLAGLVDNYRRNPQMKLNANEQAYINAVNDLAGRTQEKIDVINYAEKEAEKKAIQNTASRIGGLAAADGTSYTPEEVADVTSKLKDFTQGQPGLHPVKIARKGETKLQDVLLGGIDANAATAFFNVYKGGKYKSLVDPYIKRGSGKILTEKEQNALSKLESSIKVYDSEFDNRPKYESDELMKISPSLISQVATLNTDYSKGDEQNVSRFLDKATARYNSLGKKPSWDVNKVNEWWATRKSGDKDAIKLGITFEKFGDGTGQMILSHGKEKEIIPVLPEDMGYYFKEAAKSSPFNEYRKAMRVSPNHTTNLAGAIDDDPVNGVNARYTGHDMPQLKGAADADLFRYDLIESPNNTGRSETDKYLFVGYVKDPKTDVWKRQELSNGYEGEGKMIQILSNWNKNNIKEAQKTWK